MLRNLLSEDEFLQIALKVPLQTIEWQLAANKGVEVMVRRDDIVDADLSGNKFYKLFYNLLAAKEQGYTQILSFGGAYSNHIHALAAAGYRFGIKTVGVIRGERPKTLSPCLQDAEAWGMKLHFISRSDYSVGITPELDGDLHRLYGDFYSIPEGGANLLGVKGTQKLGWALSQQLSSGYTHVCVACGTGNTLAGIAAGLAGNDDCTAIGFSVLKGAGDLGKSIKNQHQTMKHADGNWRLISGFHGGGYAKKLPLTLQQFYASFEAETKLILDPVYTLKMCWGVAQLIEQHYWPRGSRLVLVHTGGLQGRRGF